MRRWQRYGTKLYVAFDEPMTDPQSDPAPDTAPGEDEPRCSAKACREPAQIDLQWRNPSLHDATRVKHWLACPAHADSLADFLSARGFLLGRTPLS